MLMEAYLQIPRREEFDDRQTEPTTSYIKLEIGGFILNGLPEN